MLMSNWFGCLLTLFLLLGKNIYGVIFTQKPAPKAAKNGKSKPSSSSESDDSDSDEVSIHFILMSVWLIELSNLL